MATSKRLVRLAAVQAAPVAFDAPATILKLQKLAKEAAQAPNSADIIVFPEAFVSCYPRGHDFGAMVGSRTDAGRDWFRRYYESAIDIEGDSEEWQAIRAVAAEVGAVLVVGVIEKDPKNHSTLFCTAVTIDKDGTLLAKHRKLMPTASERLVWGQGDGSGIQVVDTDVGKVNYQPPRVYYHKGSLVYSRLAP